MADIKLLKDIQAFAEESGKMNLSVKEVIKSYFEQLEQEDYFDVVPEGALPPVAPFAHEDF